MKYYHALLCCLLLGTACTASDWQTCTVDEHLTLRLPEKPTPVDLSGMRFPSPATQQTANSASVRALSVTDNSGTYGVIINRQALPNDLQQPIVRDSFYNQGIRNVLQREHSTVLERAAFTTPAGKGIAVKFRLAAAPTGQAMVQYIRTVLVGNAAYTFTFQPRDDQAVRTIEQRRRFFNSITITP